MTGRSISTYSLPSNHPSRIVMGETDKSPIVAGRPFEAAIELQHVEVTKTTGTAADRAAMHRMGKVQELRRNFRFVSVWAFSMILMSSWETMLGYVCIFDPWGKRDSHL